MGLLVECAVRVVVLVVPHGAGKESPARFNHRTEIEYKDRRVSIRELEKKERGREEGSLEQFAGT